MFPDFSQTRPSEFRNQLADRLAPMPNGLLSSTPLLSALPRARFWITSELPIITGQFCESHP